MYHLFTILGLVAAILLILIVLIQNSKGGGLVSNFSSQNQIVGVQKTSDFLEKATWTLAVSVMVFCIVASISINTPGDNTDESAGLKNKIENTDNGLVPENNQEEQ